METPVATRVGRAWHAAGCAVKAVVEKAALEALIRR